MLKLNITNDFYINKNVKKKKLSLNYLLKLNKYCKTYNKIILNDPLHSSL